MDPVLEPDPQNGRKMLGIVLGAMLAHHRGHRRRRHRRRPLTRRGGASPTIP
ncbi:hypothetical protein [Streptomyces sp. CS62]|uniref:hypothetical protein n=1 Tax=Streptomyces sp. CS62 TaxID=3119268 RepID=UPI002F945E0F